MATPVATSDSRYDFLFRSTADGIMIADPYLIIKNINPAACGMLGLTVEDVLEKRPEAIFSKNPPLMNLFIRTGSQKIEVRLPRRRLAQGIGDTLENGDRVVILQDVTERRDLENRRDNLTRTIAHDLRNPISAISGFTDLVTKSGELNELQRKFLLRARQTSNKINDMLISLVDLAWIEAGMPLQHIPIHMDDAIQKAVNELEYLAKKHRIGIVLSLQKPLPIVMGDPARLHLAIYHIIHNAITYSLTPEKNVVIHSWSDDNEIYCNVADQGIGIADNELELIFDRMYRSRDERVMEINGGGLGLTIAKTIIKRHGGDIWASSNFDVGTTISFVLPIVEQ
jgi:signal transduction histidine kinase